MPKARAAFDTLPPESDITRCRCSHSTWASDGTAAVSVGSSAGVQLRRDRLEPVGLYLTTNGRRRSTTREDKVGQGMIGVFGQSEVEWTRWLRTTVGLRADRYQFSVTSNTAANSGDGSGAIVSPKFGAVFGPWSGTEFYANAGIGFHSNDARGAVITVDPATGEPADRVTPLVRAKGAEFGVRTVAGRRRR